MRIETNERLIKRNRQIATYLFLFSLGVLIAGFLFANGTLFGIEALENVADTLYLVVMPAVLIVGMTATLFSVRMTNLWIRVPRPEDVIESGLKGIGKKSTLYHYYHFPARHVLVAPQGVFAIVTRFQENAYTVQGDRWTTHRSAIGRLLGVFRFDGIGSPMLDAAQAAQQVQRFVDAAGSSVKVQPLVVFVDSRTKLTITQPTVPVLFADSKLYPNLKDYLRDLPKESHHTLTSDELERFDEITKSGRIPRTARRTKTA